MSTEGGAHDDVRSPSEPALIRLGRRAWALVGLAVLFALLAGIASVFSLVFVPLVLALFPATLLVPVAAALRSLGAPRALAALLSLVGGVLLIGITLTIVGQIIASEAPELTDSVADGMGEVEQLLVDDPLGIGVNGLADLFALGQEQLEQAEVGEQALAAAVVAFEVVVGAILMVVVLFFYLKDGRRLTEGVLRLVPRGQRDRWRDAGLGAWDTIGRYFRGQLLVAAVDGIVIGIGLVILGVPMALPLAVLIFFGGLFPIVGAITTGALAVFVALADGGLTVALIVLGLVIAVQQLESNVLQPYILGNATALHPLMVLLSVSAGAVLLGVLGAFIAVPIAAVVARVYRTVGPPTASAAG
jgi:putative heme transporter